MIIEIAVNFYLTWKCNLQCDHCQYACHPNESKEMTDEQIQCGLAIIKSITQFTNVKIAVIGLTGGEALLHPRFWPILDYINALKQQCQNSFRLELHTNGTQHIDDEIIKYHPHIFDTTFIGCDAYHEAQKQNIKVQSLTKISKQVMLRRSMLQTDISAAWVRMMGRAKEKFENQSIGEPTKHCVAGLTSPSIDFTPDRIKFCGEIGREEYMPHNSSEYMNESDVNVDTTKELVMKATNYSIYHTGPQCLTPCIYKIARI